MAGFPDLRAAVRRSLCQTEAMIERRKMSGRSLTGCVSVRFGKMIDTVFEHLSAFVLEPGSSPGGSSGKRAVR